MLPTGDQLVKFLLPAIDFVVFGIGSSGLVSSVG